MYIAPINEVKDNEVARLLIQNHPFGLLISTLDGLPWATHIPFEIEEDNKGNWFLLAHIAKANPQWRQIPADSPVLVSFLGAHAYISASWYKVPNVSTWNYEAVQLYGQLHYLDEAQKLDALTKLTQRYEQHSQNPVTVDRIPAKTMRGDIKGLVAFKIIPTDIQIAQKFSQNRDQQDFENIIAQLRLRNQELDQALANQMEQYKQEQIHLIPLSN
jgi:transcriptional regulator